MKQLLSIILINDYDDRLISYTDALKALRAGKDCEVFLVGETMQEDLDAFLGRDEEHFRLHRIDTEKGMAADLNAALDACSGDIIHIGLASCVYDAGGIDEAENILRRGDGPDIVSLLPKGTTVKGTHFNLDLSSFGLTEKDLPVTIDIEEKPYCWGRQLFSLFIRRDVLAGIRFDEDLEYEYERAFLSRLFAVVHTYRLLPEAVVTFGFTDRDKYNYHPYYEKRSYFGELSELAREVLSLDDPLRTNQRILMDYISAQFAANEGDKNKALMVGEDLDGYLAGVTSILRRIDDDIISILHGGMDVKRLPLPLYYIFLCMKYGKNKLDVHPVISSDPNKNSNTGRYSDGHRRSNDPTFIQYDFVTENGTKVVTSERLYLNIMAINKEGNELVFDAEMNNAFFDDEDNIDISISGSNGEAISIHPNRIYSLRKIFGVTVYRKQTFRFAIPLDAPDGSSYRITLRYKGIALPVRCRFRRQQARVRQNHDHNYWEVGGRTFRYDNINRKFVLTTSGWFGRVRNEVLFWKDILDNMKDQSRARSFIALRILYFLTKPYYKNKNIWITFDQLFKGGDNGEYFYRYVNDLSNKDQILYYVINKDTKEYRELKKKYKTVLEFNSLKHKLLSLHAKIVFTTRADAIQYTGFARSAESCFRNLFNFDIVCLQHGLSIQQIAQYQNRVFDNLKYYFCVSKYEIANLSKPIYGFEDKSMLVLTGAPRYDGLVGTPKKQIIIAPTWRRNVTSGTNKKGSNHEYSTNFKGTTYYKIYNTLINDPELLKCANETGYKLIYLIHPILSPQMDDFDKNDVVTILPGTQADYEKILVESALMLTDHSGIMYDFAYQRKPLVYYHPDELPPQYAEGGLNYETMGFGPVCRTHEDVVKALCDQMRRSCTLEEKYSERIEDFFEFDDQRNCERVYLAAKDFQANRQGK